MTIGKFIEEKLSKWAVEISDTMIDVELSRLNLTASESMTGEINLDVFFYNILPDILLMPNSVSEGGFSISYNKEFLEKYYISIANALKKPNMLISIPKITDASNKW